MNRRRRAEGRQNGDHGPVAPLQPGSATREQHEEEPIGVWIFGLFRELIIHPGETLAEVIEDQGMTQRDPALRIG